MSRKVKKSPWKSAEAGSETGAQTDSKASEEKPKIYSGLGRISRLLTMAILLAIALWSGVMEPVLKELMMFFTGDVKSIPAGALSFQMMLPTALTVVLIEMLLALLVSFCVSKILHKHEGHEISDYFTNMKSDHHFQTMLFGVALEEVLTRWLILGVLTKISFLSGTVAFYALCIIGNLIWALAHLANYKRAKDRNPLRVLTQFVGGFFFTYVFVKYGLLASILVHLVSNLVLLSVHKKEYSQRDNLLTILSSAATIVLSLALFNGSLTDIWTHWLVKEPTFSIPGWAFWDYVAAYLLVWSVLSILVSITMHDKLDLTEITSKNKYKILQKSFWDTIGESAFGILIGMVIMVVISWIVGWFSSTAFYQVAIAALLAACFVKTHSGSSMARLFWLEFPAMFMVFCIVKGPGFFTALATLLACMVSGIPLFAIQLKASKKAALELPDEPEETPEELHERLWGRVDKELKKGGMSEAMRKKMASVCRVSEAKDKAGEPASPRLARLKEHTGQVIDAEFTVVKDSGSA